MTRLLKEAFEKANTLPQEEQDRLARFMLAELDSERRWAELFSSSESEDLLEKMSAEALSAHNRPTFKPKFLTDQAR